MREHKTKIIITGVLILLAAPTESVNVIYNLLIALQSLLRDLHLH